MKLETEEVYKIVREYLDLGFDYTIKNIPNISQQTGWAETSILLVIENDLANEEVEEDSDFEVATSNEDEIEEDDIYHDMYVRQDGDPKPLNFHDKRR